jgi:hypothetical protein
MMMELSTRTPFREPVMISAEVFAQIERMGDLPSLPRTLLSIQSVAATIGPAPRTWLSAFSRIRPSPCGS